MVQFHVLTTSKNTKEMAVVARRATNVLGNVMNLIIHCQVHRANGPIPSFLASLFTKVNTCTKSVGWLTGRSGYLVYETYELYVA